MKVPFVLKPALCLLAFLTLAPLQSAHAVGTGFGIQAGLSRHKPSFSGSGFSGFSSDAHSKLMARVYTGLGFGLLSAELGGFVGDRKYSTIAAGSTQNTTYGFMGVDLMARANLSLFSIGVGPYWGFILGTVDTETAGVTTTRKATAAGIKFADYGAVASARVAVPLGPVSVTGDARYLLGINDTATRSDGETKTREWQFLAGVQFGF